MSYKLIGKNKLIPQKTLTGRHVSSVKKDIIIGDMSSPFTNKETEYVFEEFEVLECSVQPIMGKAYRDYALTLLPEGFKDYESYYVFSTTPLLDAQEGTNNLPDQIKLKNNRFQEEWFTVIKTDRFSTTDIERYQCFVISAPFESLFALSTPINEGG